MNDQRVAERALPATIALHNALQSQLGVDNRIGATFGEVYCGAVGGVKRHGTLLFAHGFSELPSLLISLFLFAHEIE